MGPALGQLFLPHSLLPLYRHPQHTPSPESWIEKKLICCRKKPWRGATSKPVWLLSCTLHTLPPGRKERAASKCLEGCPRPTQAPATLIRKPRVRLCCTVVTCPNCSLSQAPVSPTLTQGTPLHGLWPCWRKNVTEGRHPLPVPSLCFRLGFEVVNSIQTSC